MKWLGMALALVFATGSLAAQQPPPPPPPPRPGPPAMGERGMPPMGELAPMMGEAFGYLPDRLIDRRDALSLSPEQVSRLAALAQDAKQAREKAMADAKTHWDQLAELWKQPTPDVGQVRTHAQAAMQAMQTARLAQLTATAQAKAVLTPEQRGRVAGWADAQRGRMMPGPRGPGMMDRGGMRRGWMRLRMGPGGFMRPPRPAADTGR